MRGRYWQFVLSTKGTDFYFSMELYKDPDECMTAAKKVMDTFPEVDVGEIRMRKLRVASS